MEKHKKNAHPRQEKERGKWQGQIRQKQFGVKLGSLPELKAGHRQVKK